MIKYIDRIWEYSSFFGNLLTTANRLHEENESYAAFLVLFNVLEQVCKSLRETDNGNVANDIKWLSENGLISEEDEAYLNGDNGIRKIRNIMTHRDPYSYFFERNGILYSFADAESWDLAYDEYAPRAIEILFHAITNKD